MMIMMVMVVLTVTNSVLRNVPQNLSLIASVFTAERMTNKSGTV